MTPRRTAAGFLCAYLVVQAAYGQDVGARDEAGAPGAKARPVPTTEQLRAVLKQATEALKTKAEANNDGDAFQVPDFRAMQQRATEAETADALRAVGRRRPRSEPATPRPGTGKRPRTPPPRSPTPPPAPTR